MNFLRFIVAVLICFSCSKIKSKQDVNNTNKGLAITKQDLPASPNTDTIDYTSTWINKGYLDNLLKSKSHAKVWNKYDITCIGLAPDGETLILVRKKGLFRLRLQTEICGWLISAFT